MQPLNINLNSYRNQACVVSDTSVSYGKSQSHGTMAVAYFLSSSNLTRSNWTFLPNHPPRQERRGYFFDRRLAIA